MYFKKTDIIYDTIVDLIIILLQQQ